MSNKKKSVIKIGIELDTDKIPKYLDWEASDDPVHKGKQECKGVLLAIFDKKRKETLKIDLWTKEMEIGEMNNFFFQTLRGMADTLLRATQNKEMAESMQQFAYYFGEKTNVIPKNQ